MSGTAIDAIEQEGERGPGGEFDARPFGRGDQRVHREATAEAENRMKLERDTVLRKAIDHQNAAKAAIEEATWLAETVFEANEDRPRLEFEEARSELAKHRQDFQGLEQRMIRESRRYLQRRPRRPEAPTTLPADPETTLRLELATAEVVERFRRIPIAIPYRGPIFVLPFVAAIGGGAGLGWWMDASVLRADRGRRGLRRVPRRVSRRLRLRDEGGPCRLASVPPRAGAHRTRVRTGRAGGRRAATSRRGRAGDHPGPGAGGGGGQVQAPDRGGEARGDGEDQATRGDRAGSHGRIDRKFHAALDDARAASTTAVDTAERRRAASRAEEIERHETESRRIERVSGGHRRSTRDWRANALTLTRDLAAARPHARAIPDPGSISAASWRPSVDSLRACSSDRWRIAARP